ncbi:MAG: hypothetical protein WCE75_10815 [Terracidiphilus sp.]
MGKSFNSTTTYFLQEGKENLFECLRLSFVAAAEHEVDKIVIFTSAGQGLRLAEEQFRSEERYSSIQLIGVTFPKGKKFTTDKYPSQISSEDAKWFESRRIPIVRAHLPFDPIRPTYPGQGVLAQDSILIGNALGVFGGGMSLCIQATLMACDAGEVEVGEHVIALSADTSILVRCAPTARLLTDLIVREIVCKPALLTIGKREGANDDAELPFEEPLTLEGNAEPNPKP